jgi:ABC-2 type transport system permease protein
MIGWIMRLLPPGSFVWLVLHELRLARRPGKRAMVATIIGAMLVLAWIAFGIWIATLFAHTAIKPGATGMAGAAVGAILLFTFMTTQSILASQRTLYGAGDLDLLFTAPIPPRTVMRAKLVGIAATVVLSFALIVLPVALPLAYFGHPRLFGIPALIFALALTAACFGLAVTLILARIAGPRAARTVGQMVAALSGGAVFLVSQFMSNGGGGGRRGAVSILFERMVASGFGTHGVGALPGMAAFGDPFAVTALLAGSLLLFILTTRTMQSLFLSGYRAGGMRLSRPRRATRSVARQFHAGLFGAVFAKEWRLMARDPALTFQVVLRLIYLAPLFFLALKPGTSVPIAPSLAFSSVLIAGQIVSSLVWLAVSGEDTPDLIKVAPVQKHQIDAAKLSAALVMATPIALIVPVGIAFSSIPGAILTLVVTGVAGWMSGLIEVTFAKPAPRSTFRRRQGGGSILRGIAQFAVTIVFGAVAAGGVYLMTEPVHLPFAL